MSVLFAAITPMLTKPHRGSHVNLGFRTPRLCTLQFQETFPLRVLCCFVLGARTPRLCTLQFQEAFPLRLLCCFEQLGLCFWNTRILLLPQHPHTGSQ